MEAAAVGSDSEPAIGTASSPPSTGWQRRSIAVAASGDVASVGVGPGPGALRAPVGSDHHDGSLQRVVPAPPAVPHDTCDKEIAD